MITVAETGMFQRKVTRLLSEHEREDLVTYLSEHPNAGVIMEGTGGIRKLRWARSGGGKSGGIRAIYYFHDESKRFGVRVKTAKILINFYSDPEPMQYLLTALGKNEKANLSKQERYLLTKAVKKLVAF